MITWHEFERQQPALAAAGRRQLYQIGIGLAFLATIRPNGGPRVHPVCPVISAAGLHLLIVPGPKQADLRRDGRYSLHSETCPPPRQDDGFALTGRAREITDPQVSEVVRGQVRAERGGGRLRAGYRTVPADADPRRGRFPGRAHQLAGGGQAVPGGR
jgi:hypothetical protein